MLTIETRLQLLQESGQASPAAVAATRMVVAAVEERFNITVSEANGAPFVTHLVIALTRLAAGEALRQLPAAALSEAQAAADEWALIADRAGAAAATVGATLPEAEVAYLTLHLSALLQGGEA